MFYPFPKIDHIDQVKEAIAGRDEFIIAEREGHSIVNYLVHLPDSFPPLEKDHWGEWTKESELYAIRRECRGLIFGPDGQVISRRYHKFFNVNERPETMLDQININKLHVIMEKLDGSMITPVLINEEIRWCTKMGVTDMTPIVEEFVKTRPQYTEMAKFCLASKATPIFEWCSRKHRIVIDHPEDRLVLTAIRQNHTGYYLPYDSMDVFVYDKNIPLVQLISANSIDGVLELAKEMKDIEGWVVRFDDGHMLKIKLDWYCRLHHTKDILSREKDIVELLVNSQMDDQKAFMLEEDLKKVEEYEAEFANYLIQRGMAIKEHFKKIQESGLSRKDFALGIGPWGLSDLDRSIIFKLWDNPQENVYGLLNNIVKNNVSTGRKFEAIKKRLFPDLVWNYYKDMDGE